MQHAFNVASTCRQQGTECWYSVLLLPASFPLRNMHAISRAPWTIRDLLSVGVGWVQDMSASSYLDIVHDNFCPLHCKTPKLECPNGSVCLGCMPSLRAGGGSGKDCQSMLPRDKTFNLTNHSLPCPSLTLQSFLKLYAWPACQVSGRGLHWMGQGSRCELYWETGKPKGSRPMNAASPKKGWHGKI
eukprot:1152292-Pelagomonas_calceolata.AAC.3